LRYKAINARFCSKSASASSGEFAQPQGNSVTKKYTSSQPAAFRSLFTSEYSPYANGLLVPPLTATNCKLIVILAPIRTGIWWQALCAYESS
jgi:hypothetical protein